ncbi:MAG: hypothetical protein ACI8QS_003401 [Planctomycetota bacterium]|jgi:hypothetical protein
MEDASTTAKGQLEHSPGASAVGKTAVPGKPTRILAAQIVTTMWMLVLGFFLLEEDRLTGQALMGGAAGMCVVALALWLTRSRRTDLGSMGQFLWITTPVYAAVCLTIYLRSSSGHWKNGPELADGFPYWIIAIPPAMAFVLKRKEQE